MASSTKTYTIALWAHTALLALAAGIVFSAPKGVIAQTSAAVCQSNFSWASNDRQQNPCVVAAYVQGACVGGQWTVPVLGRGQHYVGPTKDKANPCTCSTVSYNLISACGMCQGQVAITWSLWSRNCTDDLETIGGYPLDIPEGTAIPAWAYLDPTTSDNLDLALAESMAQLPDSTGVPGQTGSGGSKTSTNPNPTGTGGSSNSNNNNNSSSSPNVGAIVGGVVGGLVVLGLIIVGVVFFLKKRGQKKVVYEPGPSMSGYPGGPVPTTPQPLLSSPPPQSTFSGGFSGAQSPPPQSVYGGSQSVYHQGYAPSVTAPTPRPYNPDDPTTYPATLGHPGSSHTPVSSRPGHYTGAAEI